MPIKYDELMALKKSRPENTAYSGIARVMLYAYGIGMGPPIPWEEEGAPLSVQRKGRRHAAGALKVVPTFAFGRGVGSRARVKMNLNRPGWWSMAERGQSAFHKAACGGRPPSPADFPSVLSTFSTRARTRAP